MSSEFEIKVLEKLESLERKIDYVDQKITNRISDLSTKLEYTNNNVSKILQNK